MIKFFLLTLILVTSVNAAQFNSNKDGAKSIASIELESCIDESMDEAANDNESYELDYEEAKDYCIDQRGFSNSEISKGNI